MRKLRPLNDRTKNIENEIKELMDSDLSGYKIQSLTGITHSQISRLRNGSIKLDNLRWTTVSRLLDLSENLKKDNF